MKIEEQHILIDWINSYSYEVIEKLLIDNDLILIKIKEHSILQNKVHDTMCQFYNLKKYQWSKNDPRGKERFTIYLIKDKSPIYKERNTSKGIRKVNVKMYDLKNSLRASINGKNYFIHGTDNIQETKDNLRTLSLFEELYVRKSFDNIETVFNTLNQFTNFKWLILRNFEKLPHNIYLKNHGDIDLLVDDFFMVKSILDSEAISINNRYEDGGKRVLQSVLINKEEVLFDFRYLGDNYYHLNWEKDLLKKRKKYKMFYIPDEINYKYSILYHAIVHKTIILENYKSILKLFFKTNNRILLKKKLENFMELYGYTYVKPESSVGYFPWKMHKRFINKFISLKNKLFKTFRNLIKKNIFKSFFKSSNINKNIVPLPLIYPKEKVISSGVLCKDPQGKKVYSRVYILKDKVVKQSNLEVGRNERKALIQLNHQSVPKLIGYVENSDYAILELEKLPGITLKDILNSSIKLSEQECILFSKKLYSVLKFIHSKGVEHRDINPGNILWCSFSKKLSLIDFGWSYINNQEKIYTPFTLGGIYGFFSPYIFEKFDNYSAALLLSVLSKDYNLPEVDNIIYQLIVEDLFKDRSKVKKFMLSIYNLHKININELYLVISSCSFLTKFNYLRKGCQIKILRPIKEIKRLLLDMK